MCLRMGSLLIPMCRFTYPGRDCAGDVSIWMMGSLILVWQIGQGILKWSGGVAIHATPISFTAPMTASMASPMDSAGT